VRVVIEASAEDASSRVAELVARKIRSNPCCVLGLATGRTMEPVYAKLAAAHRNGGVSLSQVRTFSLDEYIGATREDSWSFASFATRHLVAPTDLPPSSVHVPDGAAADILLEAEQYEGAIRRSGGIDLQLLGLGANGHIGFNEPGSSLRSRTRVKALTAETLRANQDDLPLPADALPRAAITVGLGTILSARACVLIAVGSAKAAAVAAMVEGPVTAKVPASVLQLHPAVTAVLDEAAAADLEGRAYYATAERLQREFESQLPQGGHQR
jgi:glucosamine-6-phosphate deaminase